MAYDHDDKPPLHLRASKELFDRKLGCELKRADRAGARVLVIRPNAEEAHVHGLNLMRSGGNSRAAELSYQRTRSALSGPEGRSFAAAWRAANRSAERRGAA